MPDAKPRGLETRGGSKTCYVTLSNSLVLSAPQFSLKNEGRHMLGGKMEWGEVGPFLALPAMIL